ncbi:uncharacterized protein [Nicotiana tomentosiformis]|uniref:uncharacterized protein n=1 Tax=Nicotiana tomentosiformis TaxID=4098 RepID=UPI00388C6EAC
MQLHDFWNGLTPAARRTLSNAAERPLMKKTPEERVTILDELSKDAKQWPSEIAKRRRSIGVHQVDANTSVQVQLDAMDKEIRKLTLASIHSETHAACNICGRGHPNHEYQALIEEVNVVGNYNFNAIGQKHPSFSWSSPGGYCKSMATKQSRFQGQRVPGFMRLDAHGSAVKELGTGLRNLEKQMGQIATILFERILVHREVVPEKQSEEKLKIEGDKRTKGKKGVDKKKKEDTLRKEDQNESEHMPALPFPQKLYREKMDKKFERFLNMLRQEILTKKRKIEETSVVKLTEHCSAILQNKVPQKYGDPGSFTIPYSLGTLNFDKSLCDSGASVSLMPLSIYRKLENDLGEIRSAPIYLQLAEQTTIISEGIVEDVLVRVDKFVFHVDFIVVKMEGNKEVPLILGRPFLAMGRAILDIHDRKLMLRVGEHTVTFEMNVGMWVRKEKPAANV